MPVEESSPLLAAVPARPGAVDGCASDERAAACADAPSDHSADVADLGTGELVLRSTRPLRAPHGLADVPLTLPPPPAEPVLRRLPPARTARSTPWVLDSLRTSAKLGAITFLAYGLMFNFSVVRGSSMAPLIHDGDRILVDHLSYVFSAVERGDIVVLRYPLDPSLDYIKRVIGLPGDSIEIRGGVVKVNGVELDEPYIASQDPRTDIATRVEPEHFYVLGDNRAHSSDSREFGQVPRANLRGKVDLRVWPPTRVGTLH